MNPLIKKILHDDCYVTSGYGTRTYEYQGKMVTDFHEGIDYGTNAKSINVYSIAKGTVLETGFQSARGNYVKVDYVINGNRYRGLYQHLRTINTEKGKSVSETSIIGTTGESGQATGIHLHLEWYDYARGSNVDFEKWNWPTTTPTNPGSYQDYTIIYGDTLYGISQRFGTTVDSLASLNNIADPDLIRAGATIKVPKTTSNVPLKEGDKVKIIGEYASSSDAKEAKNTAAIGWERTILKIIPKARYPYMVGSGTIATGFFQAESLKKI